MDLGTGASIEHATVLFSMVCAGGSKQWQMLASSGGTRIGVIMRSQLKTHEFAEIPCNTDLAKGVLVSGGSSVEIRTVACIESTNIYPSVIATGGEDGYLRLCRPPRSDLKETGLMPLFEARRHTSAIRCICISGPYLFTGGGGCELRCWRYYRDGEFELSDYAVAPSLGDSRVMDVVVIHKDESIGVVIATAYSDASIRLWRLDSLNRQLVCVAQDVNSTNRHCVLSLNSFSHNTSVNGVHRSTKYVVSGSTSGQLAFWDVTQFLEPNVDLKTKRDLGPPILLQENVHQSGVNTIAISSHHDACSVSIATGGDDGSVAIWEYSAALSDPLSTKLKLVARRTDAHASAVQAVAFLDGHKWVCSLGTDQRLAIWSVNNGHLDLAHMACSQVADPSAMAILDSTCRSVVIVGIGIEFINFQ
ncbi:WD repeat-containing protein 6 [Coemansia sp. BCRC 34490]|nr:WD repeat-containing protein 6 [Coemansia sp. BCRC 34490]